jgi:hypothetical protein
MSLEEVYRGVVLKVFLQYDTSHWTVNGGNIFWGLFPLMHQYHAIYLQFTQGFFIIFLFNSQHTVQNSSTVLYTVVLHSTTATGHLLQNTCQQWLTQEFFFGGVSTNSVEDRGQRERGLEEVAPQSGFHSIYKWVKPVFLLGCYGCIFHGTRNLAQLCQNLGFWGFLNPPNPPRYATACQHFVHDAYFVKALQINTICSTA